MTINNIKYPIGFDKVAKKLVDISNVTDDIKTNFICKECAEDFVAVLNHQTPHFKHKSNSSCKGTSETYLHWLAKEVFKEIKSVDLPELLIDDLQEKQRERFQLVYNKIIDSNIPELLRVKFKKELKRNLTEGKVLKIENIETEKEYKTDLGNVLIDIIATNQIEKVFIEPFFSNPVNNEKKNKLLLIDISTFSIDLKKIIENFGHNFTIQILKMNLISENLKKWVYIRENDFKEYLNNYENYLYDEIKKFSPYIELYENISMDISDIETKKVDLNHKLIIIRSEISELEREIDDLNTQRDNIFLDYELK